MSWEKHLTPACVFRDLGTLDLWTRIVQHNYGQKPVLRGSVNICSSNPVKTKPSRKRLDGQEYLRFPSSLRQPLIRTRTLSWTNPERFLAPPY